MTEVLRSAFQRALRRDNRRASIRPGRLERIDFDSEGTKRAREITLYLPPGYDEHPEDRYPVLYMQDGQNLFEDERAFAGRSWRLSYVADDAIAARTVRPIIIAGIDHAGDDRVDEYTSVRDEKRDAGGRARDYAYMLIDEVMPMVDRQFRTIGGRENVAVGGSSLGGLVALYLLMHHPLRFGRGLVMSPSVWWGGRAILRDLELVSGDLPRIWLDVGGREGREALSDVRLLRDRMVARGWKSNNLRYYEERRAEHSERAWGARVRMALEFLFPPES